MLRTVPALLLLVAACGSSTTGDEVDVGGTTALTWGDGPSGVVLAHGASYDAASWEDQATVLADHDLTVLAVEEITPEVISAAVDELRSQGIDDVALVGASAGADAILQLERQDPELGDQLVLLSPNAVVDGLGDQPKLFIASKDEAVADVSPELARSAPGDDNEVVLLPGSAHAQGIFSGDQGDRALDLIVDRLTKHATAPGSG